MLKIRRPDDMHIHLRQGEMLRSVVKYTEQQFARALVMPNTLPATLNYQQVNDYRNEIKKWAPNLEPLMTIKLTSETTPQVVRDARALAGVIAGKLYPEGVTTNSEDGVSSITSLYPVFEAMQDVGMVLSLHGETPGVFTMDRETTFLETLKDIVRDFPKLKVVLEHITTAEAVRAVEQLPDTVAATITVHHLYLTLDDIVGGSLNPHAFCKPVAKRPEDRAALIKAVFSHNPKFFLGTDSAPHLIHKKECSSGCAGVFSAPVAMQCLTELFMLYSNDVILEGFTSIWGAAFYDLPLNDGFIELVKEDWKVPASCYVQYQDFMPPDQYNSVAPFMAGKTLTWKLT